MTSKVAHSGQQNEQQSNLQFDLLKVGYDQYPVQRRDSPNAEQIPNQYIQVHEYTEGDGADEDVSDIAQTKNNREFGSQFTMQNDD